LGILLGGAIGAGAAIFAAPVAVIILSATTAGAAGGYVVADSIKSETWTEKSMKHTYCAPYGH
jgi:hypothetical protein